MLTEGFRRDRRYKHGYFGTPTYTCWASMIARCTNERNSGYKKYGARGIRVCARWRNFINFLADMGERPAGTSIDRINNYLGYSPKNCRWATKKVQANNGRTNTFVKWSGETKTLSEWADHCGVPYRTFCSRWMKKFSLERLMRPPINQATMISFDGRTQSATEWGKEVGIPGKLINRRLREGEPIEKVLFPGNLKSLWEKKIACYSCKENKRASGAYCLPCWSAYMRKRRANQRGAK